MQQAFQPLPISLCFNFGNIIFEEEKFLVHFWKLDSIAMHELTQANLHVHLTHSWYKPAIPIRIGPSMRLYRPMHGGPLLPCTRVWWCMQLPPSINTMPCPLNSSTWRRLNLCWIESPPSHQRNSLFSLKISDLEFSFLDCFLRSKSS